MVQNGPFVRDFSGVNRGSVEAAAAAAAANASGHRHGGGSGSGSGYAFGQGYGYGYGNGNGNGYGYGYGDVDEKKKSGSHRGGGLLPTSAKDAQFGLDRKYDSDEEDEDGLAREKGARHLQTRNSYEGRVGDTLAFVVGSVRNFLMFFIWIFFWVF